MLLLQLQYEVPSQGLTSADSSNPSRQHFMLSLSNGQAPFLVTPLRSLQLDMGMQMPWVPQSPVAFSPVQWPFNAPRTVQGNAARKMGIVRRIVVAVGNLVMSCASLHVKIRDEASFLSQGVRSQSSILRELPKNQSIG